MNVTRSKNSKYVKYVKCIKISGNEKNRLFKTMMREPNTSNKIAKNNKI